MSGPAHTPDPIRHVVLLILENRSFDQMLGSLREIYPGLDGVDPDNPRSNVDMEGRSYVQAPTRIRRLPEWDPHHEVPDVAVQLSDHNGGFVRDFSQKYPDSTPAARACIMGYYPLDFLPATHRLARNFTICERWFASLPGPTWPNRFFALSGTSNGRVNMPGDGTHKLDLPGFFQQTQTTLFDRLNERGIHWKVFFHDIPQSAVLASQRKPHNAARYFYVDQFYEDARGPDADFPQFSFIEPDYLGFEQNDAHPPHDILRSERLVADVYNAIRANEALWASTLLVVICDEHGGFYDHVEPPLAIPPDDCHEEYSFARLGVRVPALLVSPWVDAGVETTQFDHTSLLKYLTDKWGLGPLGRRTAAANSIAVALQRHQPRSVALTRIELTPEELNPQDPEADARALGELSGHQKALQKLGEYLKEQGVEVLPRTVSWLARATMAVREFLLGLQDGLFDVPPDFKVSIAEPDKLATDRDCATRDNVAEFLMRMKRGAPLTIQKRLADPALSDAERRHAVQTLALISKRNFHKEPDAMANAQRWLASRGRPA